MGVGGKSTDKVQEILETDNEEKDGEEIQKGTEEGKLTAIIDDKAADEEQNGDTLKEAEDEMAANKKSSKTIAVRCTSKVVEAADVEMEEDCERQEKTPQLGIRGREATEMELLERSSHGITLEIVNFPAISKGQNVVVKKKNKLKLEKKTKK